MPAAETLNTWGMSWAITMSRSLIDASLLLLVVLIIWAPMRSRIPSHAACVLFLVVLLKAALPFPVSLPDVVVRLAPTQVFDRIVNRQASREPADGKPHDLSRTVRLPAVRATTSPGGDSPKESLEPSRATSPREGGQASSSTAAQRQLPVKSKPVSPGFSLAAFGMMVWLLVVVALITRFAWVHQRMCHHLRGASSLEPGFLSVDYRRLCIDCGLRQNVPLFVTPYVNSPAVWGLWRQVLLVPPELVESLPPAQLTWVLLHELVHVRRHDTWVVTFQRLVQIVFVFHPAVWVANRLLDAEREFACDDDALSLAAEVSRRECEAGFLAVIERASLPYVSLSPAALPVPISHLFAEAHHAHPRSASVVVAATLSPGGSTAVIIAAMIVVPYLRAQDANKPKPQTAQELTKIEAGPQHAFRAAPGVDTKAAAMNPPRVRKRPPRRRHHGRQSGDRGPHSLRSPDGPERSPARMGPGRGGVPGTRRRALRRAYPGVRLARLAHAREPP